MYENKKERDILFEYTGKYSEVKLLNEKASGFGWAVLVQDNLQDNELKVVKLPNREEATRELKEEAKILNKISRHLKHPNLVRLESVERYLIDWNGNREERYFVVLEYGGSDLRKRLGRIGVRRGANNQEEYAYYGGQPLALDELLHLAIQIAGGLRALHEFEETPGLHVVHRDIKPENILVDERGTARITDFGISKVVERLTQTITVAGTLPYLAPEYSMGRITAASDIYSLGIVLYEMATGTFPFRALSERLYNMPAAPHVVNPAVPAMLSEVILRAMWWDPDAGLRSGEAKRYQNTADLLADLKRCRNRLYPVPPQFQRLDGRDHLFRDKKSDEAVRVFLYDCARPTLASNRLVPLGQVKNPWILTPVETFESDDMIGVVVRPVRELSLGATTASYHEVPRPRPVELPPPPTGKDVYALLQRVVTLCRQIETLHRLGLYHGFLNPYHVIEENEGWLIDQSWLGALVGVASADSVFAKHPEVQGYLAPEVLAWVGPPQLRSDLYGIAALLYGRLTGKPPLSEASVRAIRQGQSPPGLIGADLRELAPGVSRRLGRVLLQALERDPNARPASLEELIQELSTSKWPDDQVASLIEDALDLQKRGLVVEAYDALNAAQRLAPGDEQVHHARARVYFLEREFKHALKENAKALNILATPSVCLLHGQCLVALGRYDEALEVYDEALRQENSSMGRHLLAQCLDKMGQVHKAVSECETALRLAQTERDPRQVEAISLDLAVMQSKAGRGR